MAEPVFSVVTKIVVFRLAEEEYGIPIDKVESIIRRETLTPVPYAPPSMVGVINQRGRIVPVIDLALRFDLPATEPSASARIVICQLEGELVGLAVDAATEVLQLPPGAIDNPPEVVSSPRMQEAVAGVAHVGERLIVLLMIEQVIPSIDELTAAGALEEAES